MVTQEIAFGATSCRHLLTMKRRLHFRGCGKALKNFKQERGTRIYVFISPMLLYATWVEGAIIIEGKPIGRLFHHSKKKRLMEMERNEKFKLHYGERADNIY